MPAHRSFLAAALLALPSLVPATARAGSISAPGYLAGPDSTAATPNPAAGHYNPAAIGGSTGVRLLLDTQLAFVRVDATSTRNFDDDKGCGIDPNTGACYKTSEARVQVPIALLGVTWKAIPDRLALGLTISDTFVGGGDYTNAEPDDQIPYEGHQRYAGVTTKVITAHIVPHVAVTTIEGVHVGAGLKVIYDTISALQAADPLHTEGVNPSTGEPYTGDSYLEGDASGLHLGWNAGIYVDKWKYARVGLSYTDNGTFKADGDAKVHAPDYLTGNEGYTAIPGNVTFTIPLPPVIQLWVNSDVTDKLTLGAGFEYQMWNVCCGGPEGDIDIDLTSKKGGPIGPDDGLTITVDKQQYSPRRLWNSGNYGVNGGYAVADNIWLGGRASFNQNAVPDYAVSATNLDYQSVGFQLAGRYQFGEKEKFAAGLSYSKFFTWKRTITESAWDLDPNDPRFTPETPYKASMVGTYQSKVDIVGIRLSGRF